MEQDLSELERMTPEVIAQSTPAGELRIRLAVSGDAPAIADLVRRAFAQQAVAVMPPPSALGETGGRIAAHLARDGGLVVTVGCEIVAACLWTVTGGDMYLSRVAVDPRWRRRGVARAMLAEVRERARAAGVSRMTLKTRILLEGNRRLFASCGFREIARHTHEGYDQPTSVEMALRLDDGAA